MQDDNRHLLLLVEDEAIIAAATRVTLEKYGYRVRTVPNGEAAVAAVANTPGLELILMDINLGSGIDGTEAAALILKDHDLPVVFLSSHMEPEVVAKTEKITSYGYVVKDSSGTVLDASIKMAFKLFAAKISEKEKESALALSEEKYHMLFREMLDGYALHEIILDEKGIPVDYRFLAVNPAFELLTGLKEEDLIGHTVREVLPGIERQWIEQYGRVALTGQPAFFESYSAELKKNFRVTAFRPKAGQFACIFADVTERMRAEATLRESEERYRAIFNNSPDAILLTSPDGAILASNASAERLFGRTSEEITQIGRDGVLDPTDPRLGMALAERARTGRFYGELSFVRKDGTKFPADLSSVVFHDREGNARTSMAIRDNSARKQAEETLREAEARYRLLFEQSSDGIVILDQETMRLLEFNETAHRQLGYTREEFAKLAISDIEAIEMPKDTRARIDGIMRDGQGEFETEHRTREGKIRNVLVRARFTMLRGRPIYHCIWRDITERKQAQAALIERENKYRELVESHQDVIFSLAADGRMEYISPAITGIMGYTQEEVTGKNLFDLVAPRERAFLAEQMKMMLARESSIGEFLFTVKDGSSRWIRASSHRVTENGKIVGIHGIMSDITESKRAAEEIKRQLEEKEILLKEVHHRIKNNFASVSALLTLQARVQDDPNVAAALEEAIGRINSMRLLYDKLLLGQDYQETSVKTYVEGLATAVISLFPVQVRVKFDLRVADFTLATKQMFLLGIIINELLTNIMKYAFVGRESGSVRLEIQKADGRVTLILHDDGVGLPEGFEFEGSKRGFGLMLVDMLSKQLEGTFVLERHEGTRAAITFSV